jgi:hypothetical protein
MANHFSRYPSQYWEESILKIKACGVDALSTYVFWIHHEEEEGRYEWSGCRNLHEFLSLCKKLDLPVVLRIGPWAHGECRNGGFPDWLVNSGIPLRTNDPAYLAHVKRFWTNILEQVKGLLFRDGGPVIALQIENEYGHCGGLSGNEGRQHMLSLKNMAIELGFSVPFYTATGWGGGVVPDGEMLPVLGAYVEAPWEQHVHERHAAPEYLFSKISNKTTVGTDLAQNISPMMSGFSYDISKYPYLTAELGSGIQVTHHRRPIISGDDIGAFTTVALGSGANMLGYYMLHGGTNPSGRFSTLQESRATGYANDVPELSYDFQAPIDEYGYLNPSYGRLKTIHMMLRDFGDVMAQASPCFPQDNSVNAEDLTTLRYCVRYGMDGGFLFLNNYQRRRKMKDKDVMSIGVKTKDNEYHFENLSLPSGKYAILPFGMTLGGLRLITSSAQLLCHIDNGGNTFVFFCPDEENPEYVFEAKDVSEICPLEVVQNIGNRTVRIKAGSCSQRTLIKIKLKSGNEISIITISSEDAYRAWKTGEPGHEHLLITESGLIQKDDDLKLTSCSTCTDVRIYPATVNVVACNDAAITKKTDVGCFAAYDIRFDADEKPARALISSMFVNENGMAEYTLKVEPAKGKSVEDTFLGIPFEGDKAKLFINGTFCADQFYTGTMWQVGLKRFGDLKDAKIKLDVMPLHEDDVVYLEKKPKFTRGVACSLENVFAFTEYGCKLKIR